MTATTDCHQIIKELRDMSFVNAIIDAEELPEEELQFNEKFIIGDKIYDDDADDHFDENSEPEKYVYFLLECERIWKQKCPCEHIMECTCKYISESGEWVDAEATHEMCAYVISSPIGDKIESSVWNKFENQACREAIVLDSVVPANLHTELINSVTELSKIKSIDWHPESNEIVNDLIHPSMYSLRREPVHGYDFWGREYEDSYYQWLPSDITIDSDGRVKFLSYINNLPDGMSVKPYEDLLQIIIPHWETMWQYARTLKIQYDDVDQKTDYDNLSENDPRRFHRDDYGPPDYLIEPMISLYNHKLQVVSKVVDMVFKPNATYEGVWHFEGMSHENIVMTAIYFLRRDQGLEGGRLEFKRAFSNVEAYTLVMSMGQERKQHTENLIGDFVPLGQLSTDEKRLLIFPNSHAHRITKFTNTTNEVLHRQIIVFFLINPDVKITSTSDILPQQHTMTYEDACHHRLELMKERKFHKQSLNTREVNLCEH